jgi:oxygen-independent coproporphyrinogen-3 oxidase
MLGGTRLATSAERLPERWQDKVSREGHGYTEQIAINDSEAAREHLLMNLRLSEGLDLAAYEKRWNIALDRKKITELAADDLVTMQGTMLAATPRGRLVLNSVIAALAA